MRPSIQRPRTDQGETSGENSPKRLRRLTRKFPMSVTETINKVCEPKTFDKGVNNLVFENRWREAIDKKLKKS